jgi:CheY-specific phosphatase CheX
MEALEVLDQRLERMTECVRESVLATFSMLTGAAPRLRPQPCNGADLVAVISFIGDHEPWSLVLALPRETALQMAPKFAGFEIEFDGPDMADAVGEIVNIIAGDLVARLEGIDLHSQMSVPSIARGQSIDLVLPDSRELLALHFEGDEGAYSLRVAARKSSGQGRPSCPHCGRP